MSKRSSRKIYGALDNVSAKENIVESIKKN